MADKLEIKVSFARQSAVRTNRIAEFEPANLHPQKPAAHTDTFWMNLVCVRILFVSMDRCERMWDEETHFKPRTSSEQLENPLANFGTLKEFLICTTVLWHNSLTHSLFLLGRNINVANLRCPLQMETSVWSVWLRGRAGDWRRGLLLKRAWMNYMGVYFQAWGGFYAKLSIFLWNGFNFNFHVWNLLRKLHPNLASTLMERITEAHYH